MGKKNDAFLLSDGDRLRLSSKTTLVFKTFFQVDSQDFDLAQEKDMRVFFDRYVVTNRLVGSGAFGKVFMAIEQSTRTQMACKVVDLRNIGSKAKTSTLAKTPQHADEHNVKAELERLRLWADRKQRGLRLESKLSMYFREFGILSSFSHPNIINIEKVFVTNSGLYIFQDFVTAGNLHTYLSAKNNNLTEVEAAALIRQVLVAVRFLHERNIMHRNMRPENVMVTGLATGARVVLTNFGSARKVLPVRKADNATEGHQAPSDQASKSGNSMLSIDMWYVGLIAALLLLGSLPPGVRTEWHDLRLASTIVPRKLEQSSRWQSLSGSSKNFVRGLLVFNDKGCMTADQALDHVWFTKAQHQFDSEELYQRAIKNWRPHIPSVPLTEFVTGRSNSIRYLQCSEKVINDRETQLREMSRSRHRPVEPPYKPFPRRMHEQGGLWPKRRRTQSMSEEVNEAIERQWSPAPVKRSDPPHRSISTGPAHSKRSTRSTLQRSATSMTKPTWRRSATLETLSSVLTPRMNLPIPASVRVLTKPVPISRTDEDGKGRVHVSIQGKGPAIQDTVDGKVAVKVATSTISKMTDRQSLPLHSESTIQKVNQIFRPRRTSVDQFSDSVTASTLRQGRDPVPLHVQSRSRLPSRSRSRSQSVDLSSSSLTAVRRRRGSIYDQQLDVEDLGHSTDRRSIWGNSRQAQTDTVKTNLEEACPSVWVHEEWLRLTEEDVE